MRNPFGRLDRPNVAEERREALREVLITLEALGEGEYPERLRERIPKVIAQGEAALDWTRAEAEAWDARVAAAADEWRRQQQALIEGGDDT